MSLGVKGPTILPVPDLSPHLGLVGSPALIPAGAEGDREEAAYVPFAVPS